jgi:hypothetical protein
MTSRATSRGTRTCDIGEVVNNELRDVLCRGTRTRGVGEVVDDELRDVPKHPDVQRRRSSRRRAA